MLVFKSVTLSARPRHCHSNHIRVTEILAIMIISNSNSNTNNNNINDDNNCTANNNDDDDDDDNIGLKPTCQTHGM